MFDFIRLTTHRRGFLGKVAAATALGMTGLAPFRIEAQPEASGTGPSNSEFEAWLGKIKGKHRQVYDATAENDGLPFAWSHVFLTTNYESAGVPESDLSVVVVLRHSAIPFAFTDPVWAKYKFGEVFKVTDRATKAPAIRNTYYKAKEGELFFPEMAIEKLMARGVLIGVCNVAMTVYSGVVATKMGLPADAVKEEWEAGLIPGVQVVPSGVLAVNRAQEHGCTYCYAG